MRQLGLALTMYTDEYHAYPFSVDFGAQRFWYDSIAPYYAKNKKVMNCAAFRGFEDVDRAVIWFSTASFFYRDAELPGQLGGVSYGYNGYGLASTTTFYTDTGNILGLGPSQNAFGEIPPIKPARLKSPVDMIAMADSMTAPAPLSQTLFTYLLAVGDGSRPSPDRHNGGSNIAFADGHVINIRNTKLTENSDFARRRWNNDHEPHEEIILH
jgi:prepilin-type processing-associated H-X9-DG protein